MCPSPPDDGIVSGSCVVRQAARPVPAGDGRSNVSSVVVISSCTTIVTTRSETPNPSVDPRARPRSRTWLLAPQPWGAAGHLLGHDPLPTPRDLVRQPSQSRGGCLLSALSPFFHEFPTRLIINDIIRERWSFGYARRAGWEETTKKRLGPPLLAGSLSGASQNRTFTTRLLPSLSSIQQSSVLGCAREAILPKMTWIQRSRHQAPLHTPYPLPSDPCFPALLCRGTAGPGVSRAFN
jgi:hypothetical protein